MTVRLSREQAEKLGITMPPTAGKPNKWAPYRSRVEKQFAEHAAEWIRAEREWKRCDYEPVSLRIGERCYYAPDFRLVNLDDRTEFVEIKDRRSDGRPYVRDKAINKLKAAASLHPMWRFWLAWPDGSGGWNWRTIGNR